MLPEWAKEKLSKSDNKKLTPTVKKKRDGALRPLIKNVRGVPKLFYSLGFLTKKLGVSRNTVKNWEEKEYIIPCFIDTRGQRWFSSDYISFLLAHRRAKTNHIHLGKLWKKERDRYI